MKKLFTLLFALTLIHSAFAQVDFAKRFLKRMYLDKDSSKKSNFVLIPALASSPETGVEIGGASLFSFYTDTVKHSITRVSNLYGYAAITTKGQEKVSLNASYWTPLNTWHYTSTLAFYNFPFSFFGIGNNTKLADKESIEEKRTRINFGAYKQVTRNLYAGLGFGGYKYYFYSGTYHENEEFKTDPNIQDHGGGSGVYIGPSISYDNRNNNTYTTHGMSLSANYNVIQGLFGSNNYTGGFLNIDLTQFNSLTKTLVLAFDLKEQSLMGGLSPFYLLPQLGNDGLMRGYYTGRYRDRNLFAGQGELRLRLTDRFGIVGFLGWGEVAQNSFTVAALKPDIGGGFRYFFDTEKGLSIRMDYGIGEKPAGEPREGGFYVALGEAF